MSSSTNLPSSGTAARNSGSAETPRTPNGQFLPGRSGNPNGRPRIAQGGPPLFLKEDADSIAEVMVSKAMAGDVSAAKLVMERVHPRLRSAAAPIVVELPPDSGPYPMAEAVLRAALAGMISPDTAAQLVGLASQLVRIAEAEELKARLEALERAVSGKNTKA
ncbi:hypothetical protein [Luteolibacter luteus]|uniref:DUF5681 domain-containing protein n=1 Tax=Luteolibacter luteus TaxID=2728835 RepID=A0A858RMA9_9BACT|nr:hypothetical protein [Luteolibacter luteus]QJE97320.1 hypothetical protein HHL09_16500 [Luteolibacter luteus]